MKIEIWIRFLFAYCTLISFMLYRRVLLCKLEQSIFITYTIYMYIWLCIYVYVYTYVQNFLALLARTTMLLRRRTVCEWEAPRAKHSHSPQLLNFISTTLWVQLWESCCYACISVCSCHVPLHVCVRVSERMTEWAHIKKSNWQWQRAGKLHTHTHTHTKSHAHTHMSYLKLRFGTRLAKFARFSSLLFSLCCWLDFYAHRALTHTHIHTHSRMYTRLLIAIAIRANVCVCMSWQKIL